MISIYDFCSKNNIIIDKVNLFSNYVIIYSLEKKYLIKKRKIDVHKLFKYFESIEFNNYVVPIKIDNEYELYDYNEEYSVDNYGKAKELIDVLVDLQNKSYSYIDYSTDQKENMFNLYKEKISECFSYYLKLQDFIEEMEIILPPYYLLLNNISKFYKLLNFASFYLEKWYSDDNNHYRESLLICDCCLNNFCLCEKKYFINLDNYKRDLLIYDFFNFYKKNYNDLDIISIFDYYNSKIKLCDNELYFLFMLISIPVIIDFNQNNYTNILEVRNVLLYVEKSLKFISEKYKENEERDK